MSAVPRETVFAEKVIVRSSNLFWTCYLSHCGVAGFNSFNVLSCYMPHS